MAVEIVTFASKSFLPNNVMDADLLTFRVYLVGFTAISYDSATDTINEEQSTATVTSFSGSASTTTIFGTGIYTLKCI